MKTISILGCGWLGFDLALKLLENNNYIVKASTTTEEKLLVFEEKGIIPYTLNSKIKEKNIDDFLKCDILVIAIPSKKEDKTYLSFLEDLSQNTKLLDIKQIIFISSTSVYPKIEKNLDEKELITLENSQHKLLFQAEQLFFKKFETLVILRCSGLMGYDRVAGKYFAGKVLDCKNDRVNYVHRDDVISVILLLIKKEVKNSIYNLCASKHPTKEEIYISNANKHNFEKPIFKTINKSINRLVDGSKISRDLLYSYKYDNPLEFK